MKPDTIIANIPSMNKQKRRDLRSTNENLVRTGRHVEAAQVILDALDQFEQQERTAYANHVLDLSITDRVVESFNKEPMTPTEQKIIQVLLDHPGATSEMLSDAAGWKEKSWQLHFGAMCNKRQTHLGMAREKNRDGSVFYSSLLVSYEEETSGFTMKEEAVKAFAMLEIKGKRIP